MSGMSIFKHGSWIAEKSISDLCREMQVYIQEYKNGLFFCAKRNPNYPSSYGEKNVLDIL